MLLYLWTRLDVISTLLTVAAVAILAAGVGGVFVRGAAVDKMSITAAEKDAAWATLWKRMRWFCVVSMVLAAVSMALPSKSDMAILLGGKFALDAGRSETAKEVGREVLDAVRAQMKKAAQ